jgi:peroxiredoxin family protein
VPLVGRERGEVDRRLGVGGEHHEHVAGRQPLQLAPGVDQRERAVQAAGVERAYDQLMIAAILESGDLERLYTGLSLLVSAAAGGEPARGLAGFGALEALVDPYLRDRALVPEAAPHVSDAGRAAFARTLHELRESANALEDCRIWACAAAVEATGAVRADVEARLDGVMSTPRFLREVAGADQLVVV